MRKLFILFTAGVLASALAMADDGDPPTRAARMSYVAGTVSFQPQAEETDWVPVDLNRALTTGDKVWVEQGGRAEIQTVNSTVRLNGHTNFSFLDVEGDTTQIQLSLGVMLIRLKSLDPNETYEVDTPQVAFTLLRPGVYRVEVNEAGDTSVITVRGGDGETTADGKAAPLHAKEQVVIKGNPASYDKHGAPRGDEFDDWAANRDQIADASVSVTKVAPGVVGAEDLDTYGTWRPAPVYGNVWFPNNLVADWAPYRFGHWAFVDPWGWTWIDDAPWGYAPFHYGRWVMVGGLWGWAPGPVVLTAVYAPALVAFIGGIEVVGVADPVSWVALSWGEPWYPSFTASFAYYDSVNLADTIFATGVIANVWGGAAVDLSFGSNPDAVNTVGRGGFAGGHPVGREFAHRGAYGGHAFDHRHADRAGARHIGATREGRMGGHAAVHGRGVPPRNAMGRSAVTRHAPGAGAHGSFKGAGVNARHGASANGGHAGAFHNTAERGGRAGGGRAGGGDKGRAGGGRAGGADKGRSGGAGANKGGGAGASRGGAAKGGAGGGAARGGAAKGGAGGGAARGGAAKGGAGGGAARGGAAKGGAAGGGAARGGAAGGGAARGGAAGGGAARGGAAGGGAARGGAAGGGAARGGAAGGGAARGGAAGGGAARGGPAGGGAARGGPAGGAARGGALLVVEQPEAVHLVVVRPEVAQRVVVQPEVDWVERPEAVQQVVVRLEVDWVEEQPEAVHHIPPLPRPSTSSHSFEQSGESTSVPSPFFFLARLIFVGSG